MKLLDKRQLNEAQASEQRLAVEQGMTLARRVDSLRETYGKEQARLLKFREETESLIKEEIQDLTKERDSLKKEVVSLQAEHDKLKEPLVQEMKELETLKTELNARQTDIEKRQAESNLAQKRIEIKEAEIAKRLLAVSEKESSITEELSNIKNLKREEQGVLASIHREQEGFNREHERLLLEVKRKSDLLDNEIRHYKDFEESLKQRAYALDVRERRLSIKENALNRPKQ